MSPIEAAARARCESDGNPPGATFEGRPMWKSYVAEVRIVLTAMAGSAPVGVDPFAWRDVIEIALTESGKTE